MVDQQTQALLSYNAGNPDMVRRIVQERGLSQEQVAQAMNLSPEAAARYGGGMNPDQGMESTQVEPAPVPTTGAPTLSNPPGMREAQAATGGMAPAIGGAPTVQPAITMGAPTISGSAVEPAPTMAQNPGGIPQAPSRPAAPMPMPVPKPMPQTRPIGMTKPMMDGGVRPTGGGRPAGIGEYTGGFGGRGGAGSGPIRAPGRGGMGLGGMGGPIRGGMGGRSGGVIGPSIGDQAFQSGFNRARGIRQQ